MIYLGPLEIWILSCLIQPTIPLTRFFSAGIVCVVRTLRVLQLRLPDLRPESHSEAEKKEALINAQMAVICT